MSKLEDYSELVYLLREEQRRSWLNGDRKLVEEYLRLRPELQSQKDAVLDFLYGEYCLREELGDAVDPQDYVQRFPEYQAELKLLFELHVAMDSAGLVDTAIIPKPSTHEHSHIDCPVCHNPMDVAAEEFEQELVCPTCGSSFQLAADRLQTWSSDALPTLGKFKLLEVVGQGAFGTVYRGRDMELQRTVAVKVPRSGKLATSEDEDRFVREARNAAQLQHSGIVPVFEVGRSDGFPYLVSEFVEGVTLADVISARRLGFREAANLLIQVAHAVDHAHTRGVVHRDLKPSNIMLTPHGVPRVMDFGLARRDAGEVTMTTDGAVLGTPAYMSPEQASGQAHHVDGRSDIYSLGVILYQLITGELPFRGNQRMMLHQVQHDEPREPRSLNDRVPRDLSTICLKAMAKQPTGRYATAGELAADLERYLTGQAIVARPVSRLHRAWRWYKRNSVVASLAASVMLLLLSMATLATVAAFRISAARDEAQRVALAESEARKQANEALLAEQAALRQARAAESESTKARLAAEQQAQNATQVASLLQDVFTTADPLGFAQLGFRGADEVGMDLPLKELLKRGANHARENLSDQQLVLATMLDTLGNVYTNLGQVAEAEPLVQEAYDLREKHGASQIDMATSKLHLGDLRRWQGRYAEAEPLLREALETRTRLLGEDEIPVAEAALALAFLLSFSKGRASLDESTELLERNYRIRLAKQGEEHRDVGLALASLALCRFWVGEEAAAKEMLLKATTIFMQQEGGEPLMALLTDSATATILRQNGDLDGAINLYHKNLPVARSALGRKHPLLLLLMGEMAGTLIQSGRVNEAEALGKEIVAIADELFPTGHPFLVEVVSQLCQLAASRGDLADAERFARRESRMLELRAGGDTKRHLNLSLAGLRILSGQFDEAARLLEENRISSDDIANGLATEAELLTWHERAAELAHCSADLPRAERLLRQTPATKMVVGPRNHLAQVIFDQRPDDPEVISILGDPISGLHPNYPTYTWEPILLARVQLQQRRVDEAYQTIQPVVEFLRTSSAPGNWNMGYAEAVMGLVLGAKGKNDEAEMYLKSGLATLRKSRGEKHWLTRSAATALHDFYVQAGRMDDAQTLEPLLVPPRVASQVIP